MHQEAWQKPRADRNGPRAPGTGDTGIGDRLSNALDGCGIGVWEHDLATGEQTWSAAQFRLHGLDPRADAPDFGEWMELVEPQDRQPFLDAVAAMKAPGAPALEMDIRIAQQPGRDRRWLACSGRQVMGGGRPVRIAGVCTDVTARRLARTIPQRPASGFCPLDSLYERGTDGRALLVTRDSLARRAASHGERLCSIFEQAGVGMGQMTPDGRWTHVNQRLCRMLGYSSAELLGMPFQDVTHPQDLQGEMDAIADLLAGGSEQVTIEKRYIRKDGQQFWGAMSLGLTRERDGAPLHFMAIVEDISQRKLTETRLRESEDRFRKLFETAPLPRYLIDPADGSISDCNPAAAAMLEYSRSELRGMKIADIAPVLTGARLQSRQSMLDGEPVKFESRHRTRSGKFRDVVVSAVPVNISGCRMAHCTVVDITERKTAEAELRRLTTDLEERVREEVAARETAQVRAARAERLQALGQLAGGIAHDFNNILQAVQGGGSIIENRAGDADTVRRYARLVIEAAERGASITRRLLAFGRRGNLLAQPLQACSILEGMRAILEPTLGAAIKVVVDVRPGLLTLLADKGQLETALVNLAVNARDAMPGGGVLTLGARASSGVHQEGVLAAGRYVSITVTDTGTGMDKATLARVFEPFFTTKPQGRGTGLGLATVKGFAEQSGGAVAVESVAGRGTAVTLWLPQAPEQDGAPDPAADTAEGSGAGAARRRVLVVDDDPLVLATLAGELEHEGFVVTAAAGGATALAALDGGLKVDAVISDLSMPDLDGLTFIREAQARLPGLPAVLLTGYVEERADLTLASKAGGQVKVLCKPLRGTELAACIQELVAGDGGG